VLFLLKERRFAKRYNNQGNIKRVRGGFFFFFDLFEVGGGCVNHNNQPKAQLKLNIIEANQKKGKISAAIVHAPM